MNTTGSPQRASPRALYSAADLAGMLAQDRRDWLPRYAPAGRFAGGMFLLGNADGDAGKSLPVPLAPGVGGFVDYDGSFRGDDLDLLARLIGGDTKAAFKEALAYLSLADGAPLPRLKPPPVPVADLPVSAAEANRERAQETWRQTDGICACNRKAMAWLASRSFYRWPLEQLRFHEACPFGESTAPAIIAPVNCHKTGLVVGIWRIKLDRTGKLLWRGGLGPSRGNASRLYWAEGDELAIAEGVEDAIAFQLQTSWPTWAALSAGNMAVLILPERFRHIVVCQDNDAPDQRGRRAGQEGAQALAHRLQAEGRRVQIVGARDGKDANDQLRRAARG